MNTDTDKNMDDKRWTVLESEYLFRRPWLTARRDKVQLPNGNINPEFYVLEYPDWVNVIAVTEDGRFIIERQYRHGIGSTGWDTVTAHGLSALYRHPTPAPATTTATAS